MSKFRTASKLVIVLALLVSMALVAETAHADPGYLEDRTHKLIDSSRDAHGRGHVSRTGDLNAIARNHSARMASAGGIFHNGNLAGEVPGGWVGLAENVGVGPSVDDIHTAFRHSPSHMANIVGGYDKVGIGVVQSGGLVYITEVFWKSADQPSYSVPAKAKKSCRKIKGKTRCSTVKKFKKKAKKVSKARRRSRRR